MKHPEAPATPDGFGNTGWLRVSFAKGAVAGINDFLQYQTAPAALEVVDGAEGAGSPKSPRSRTRGLWMLLPEVVEVAEGAGSPKSPRSH